MSLSYQDDVSKIKEDYSSFFGFFVLIPLVENPYPGSNSCTLTNILIKLYRFIYFINIMCSK